MLLDMPTVSLVSISVTAMLGFVLVFSWWQERTSALAGWWGLAQLIMSLGIIIAVAGLRTGNNDIHAFGQACMILSASIMWMAARMGHQQHFQVDEARDLGRDRFLPGVHRPAGGGHRSRRSHDLGEAR